MAKGKYGIVYGKGINDMEHGWRVENEWNYRIYRVWTSMLQRCYDEKYLEEHQTYIGCSVCERWLTLSNFVEDITKIDNYELWLSGFSEKRNPYQLDKDIKSNGKNKCYCLKECQFINYAENTKQSNKTMSYEFMKGENNPNHGELVAQIDTITDKILNLKYNREYMQFGFHSGNISACCRGKYKTSQGYIWKYINDCTDEQLQEYYKEGH